MGDETLEDLADEEFLDQLDSEEEEDEEDEQQSPTL